MGNYQTNESAFNMALKYLERANNLLDLAAEFEMRREFFNWFNALSSARGEFEIKFSDTEITELNVQEETIYQFFISNDGIDLGDNKEVRINYNKHGTISNMPIKRRELYKLLCLYEYKIKKLSDKYGMLLPSKADPRFAVLNK